MLKVAPLIANLHASYSWFEAWSDWVQFGALPSYIHSSKYPQERVVICLDVQRVDCKRYSLGAQERGINSSGMGFWNAIIRSMVFGF